jgi:hypothetical protein
MPSFLRAATAAALILAVTSPPAFANNYGESLAWQFQSANDRAAQAAILDMIERRRAGVYAAPVYTTNIARQVNCMISAVATGNSGAQSALANSPTTNGATSTATGNSNAASIADGHAGADVTSGQSNAGPVDAGVIGATSTQVRGTSWQALNSDQANNGNQTASVGGSAACAFGMLN